MYSVSFNHLLYSRDSDEDLNDNSSIFLFELRTKERVFYLLESSFGFEKTILNIVEAAVRAVDHGSQKERNFLAKLLFDFNLALVLFSPEMLKKPNPELYDGVYFSSLRINLKVSRKSTLRQTNLFQS